MLERLRRLHPFQTGEARRLALLFAIVYFAQGMWYLPNQTMTIVLKERGLSAGQVADFFFISTVPWLIKPVYALMVETGKPRGLTGAFQAVQWGAIEVSSVLVGEVGGFLAERRSLASAF